ncbi:ABC-2 type transport system permease protein [Microbacterium sp. SLBN-146]|nr:ABC-2 type transport system permease protein [Microbacterium sp. SLBN-146]
MVAHVLRLRFALLVGALRGSVGHVTRLVIGGVLLIALTIAACWALISLGDAPVEELFAVTVLGGSAITLGFAIAPAVLGVDDPLDPRRFALLALHRGRLSAAIVVAAFVSVPVIATLAVAITSAVVWGRQGASWIAGALSVLVVVTTCVLAARVFLALSTLFLRERQSRELSGLFMLVVIVVLVPAGVFVASLDWDGAVPSELAGAVSILALTPLGAGWAIPAALAGSAGVAPVAVAIVTLVALAGAWWWLVRRLLTTTERPATSRERAGLGWFAIAPGTPGGAIAARSLLYWSRDRRYLMNLVVIPVAAVVTIVPLLVAGVPLEVAVLVPVPFAALFLGWLPHNDVAYDSSAVWMHLASGVHGISDRIGRLVPVLLIGVPMLAVAVPVAAALHGDWSILPALVGVSACLFFSGLGLSSIASVVAPYAVSRPGESPFQQPQRTGSAGALAQAGVMLGAIIVTSPALWWSWEALTEDPEAATTALWGGLAIGAGVLIVGLLVGSLVFRMRGGRLMEFAEST